MMCEYEFDIIEEMTKILYENECENYDNNTCAAHDRREVVEGAKLELEYMIEFIREGVDTE